MPLVSNVGVMMCYRLDVHQRVLKVEDREVEVGLTVLMVAEGMLTT